MRDLGERLTEADFQRLKAKIKEVYTQAYEDIYKKNLDFVRRHEKREAMYRQQLADGKISKADFDAWMRGQVFQGNQWEAKRKQMRETLLNADKIAMDMVNDSRFSVFANNANYIGYELEKGLGAMTSFGLYDANSVARLLKEEPDLLPPRKVGKDESYKWYNRQIQTAITQGIIQGERIDEIAKRIAAQTGETNMKAMIRNARTMHTGAQNAGRMEGMHQAQRLGIKVKKRWMATLDGRTRDSHRSLDGQVQEVDEMFISELGKLMFPGDAVHGKPGDVWNCFVGQTNIATDSDIVRSYKHEYSGKLFVIETARGVNFTCTPNHPILTPRGWIGADRLHEGDDILIASIGNSQMSRRNPDIDHIFPRLDTLHEFLNVSGGERTSLLGVNFHGDIATTDVEVVSKKRLLMNSGNLSDREVGKKFQFKHTTTLVSAKRHLMPGLRRVYISALRLMRRAGKPLSFLGGSLSHAIKHGFRAVPWSDTAISETKSDSISGNVQFFSQSLDGFAGKVLIDNIVNINVTTINHIPVFNLQTQNGYYFVTNIIPQNDVKSNGLFAIAHNCRCTMTYVYPEYPDSMMRRDNETGEIIGDMSYREWEQWKKTGGLPRLRTNGVTGQDITATWQRRPDEYAFEIEDVIAKQGFDGLPTIVDAEEFDRMVKEANDGNGFIAQRSYSAPDQETLDAYRDQLYNGKWYVDCSTGGAQYGQGMYCAADYAGTLTDGIKNEMEHYRGLGESRYNGGGVSYTETLTLAPDAKIVTWREINDIRMGNLDTEYRTKEIERIVAEQGFTQDEATFVKYNLGTGVSWGEVDAAARRLTPDRRDELVDKFYQIGEEATRRYNEEHDRRVEMARIYQQKFNDMGSLAAALGYDAINAENHGQSGSYTVILNRTKVIIRRSA